MVDPFDPEYCFWNGQRWHVSCALRQANDNLEIMREKQGRYDTTAANYSALQAKIDDMMDQREALLKIMREVAQQAQDLGLLFIKSDKLVKRNDKGRLLDGSPDPRTILELPDAVRDRIEHHKNLLKEAI
jgi:hypothetical protein